jgi:hypothetical protein
MEAVPLKGPPALLEKLVITLIPPAARESVAGDLWEREGMFLCRLRTASVDPGDGCHPFARPGAQSCFSPQGAAVIAAEVPRLGCLAITGILRRYLK